MGFDTTFRRIIFILILILVLMPSFLTPSMFVSSSDDQTYDVEALDVLIQQYANSTQANGRTGSLQKIDLPANLSDVKASVVKIRSSRLWKLDTNVSSVYIPPKVVTLPYTKRIAMVYSNLGDQSPNYYLIPGYSLIAPVHGFTAYDATSPGGLGTKKLSFAVLGDPILISFSGFVIQNGDFNPPPKCVAFTVDGSVFEWSEMSRPNECATRKSGRFGLVVEEWLLPGGFNNNTKSAIHYEYEKKKRMWVIGFVIGLLILSLIAVMMHTAMKRKRIQEMERESEKSVAIDSIWIGNSKMPSASMIRTQPCLEHSDYVP